jgi:putative glycosyltransferase (TIGR04348 family)
MRPLWITLVTPTMLGSRTGNETTTLRWKRILERLGHRVHIVQEWSGDPCDVLVVLHAHKSRRSIERFRIEYPHRPVLLALTGTDVYGGLDHKHRSWWSLEHATRLIVLQPLALKELPEPLRRKARVIYQSVTREELSGSSGPYARTDRDAFELCMLAHLRDVKDPFRAAYAAKLVPEESRLRFVQIGGAMTSEMEKEAKHELESNPRYEWLGSIPREVALARLAECDLTINSSLREGGANAVGEAIAAGVPVIASNIPGNVGLLGPEYPGYFKAGDTADLAALLWRVESDPGLYESLRVQCGRLRPLFEPEGEERAWAELLTDAVQSVDKAVKTMRNVAQAVDGAFVRSERRRLPRVPIEERLEMEVWVRGENGNRHHNTPVTLRAVAPDGLSAELHVPTSLDMKELIGVAIRIAEPQLTIPARVVWNAPADATDYQNVGVQLQLVDADDLTRRKYLRWISAVLNGTEL